MHLRTEAKRRSRKIAEERSWTPYRAEILQEWVRATAAVLLLLLWRRQLSTVVYRIVTTGYSCSCSCNALLTTVFMIKQASLDIQGWRRAIAVYTTTGQEAVEGTPIRAVAARAIVLGATTATAVAAATAAGRSITRHGSVANISKTRTNSVLVTKRTRRVTCSDQ